MEVCGIPEEAVWVYGKERVYQPDRLLGTKYG